MFENIDINYIVIGLIVLTLVCIYLLYNTLSSGNNNIELKKHINDLVLQNKKRDEIIHFLVNQVQLLQSQPPMPEINTNQTGHDDVDDEIVEPFSNIPTTQVTHEESVNITDINSDDMAKLDELLNDDFSNIQQTEQNDTENKQQSDEDDGNVNVDGSDKDDVSVKDDDCGEQSSDSSSEEQDDESDALVDSVLSNDKLPPKDKEHLHIYTVSQLKDYAKTLNLSTTGNKETLINKIFAAL